MERREEIREVAPLKAFIDQGKKRTFRKGNISFIVMPHVRDRVVQVVRQSAMADGRMQEWYIIIGADSSFKTMGTAIFNADEEVVFERGNLREKYRVICEMTGILKKAIANYGTPIPDEESDDLCSGWTVDVAV